MFVKGLPLCLLQNRRDQVDGIATINSWLQILFLRTSVSLTWDMALIWLGLQDFLHRESPDSIPF